MIIIKLEDINIDNIIFGKIFKKYNTESINCFYNFNSKKIPLIFQTPEIFFPFDKSSFNKNQIDIAFNENNNKIIEIINKIDKKAKKFLFDNDIKNNYKSCLKLDDKYPDRLKIYLDNEIRTYDNDKNIYNGNFKNLNGKVIINMSNIWSNEKYSGIYWKALQIMVTPKILLEEFSFIEENHEIEIPEVFYKMIKNKVPLEAVKHKMMIENIDSDIIEKVNIDNINNFIPKKNIVKISKINLSELTNIKLKKVEKESVNETTPLNNPDSGFKLIPSLNDIKNGLKNLRSINSI